jgi:ubiquinone/menaquinone biosynthesis C-methylase UbiE
VSLSTFLAGQLRKPSGLFGRVVVGRVLNRGNAAMNELTRQLLELVPDDRVLEVGFGGGDLIDRMAPALTTGRIVGVDFSPDMTALCAKRFAPLVRAGRLELRCGPVETLPYADGSFTKACTVNTIYFWSDPVGALREMRRTLVPQGRLVVTFNPPATAGKLPYTKHGFTLYEPDQVRALLRDAGGRDVELVAGTSRLGEFFCAVATT